MMASPRRKAGALAAHVDGYRDWLAQRGYTPLTVRNMLKDLGQVGLWLRRERLDVADLSEDRLREYLVDRRRAGRRRLAGARGWLPLLTFLREAGVAPEAQVASTPLDSLLGRYRCWMQRERGLSESTMLRYQNTARRFLTEHAMHCGEFTPERLTGADLNAFLLRECGRVSSGSAKGRVAELRSLMRFLHLSQATPIRLGAAVPPVGGWRLASVPPMMAATDVQRLLDCCPRDNAVRVRDYAILTLHIHRGVIL
jgi:site-specific recombinase XerC